MSWTSAHSIQSYGNATPIFLGNGTQKEEDCSQNCIWWRQETPELTEEIVREQLSWDRRGELID